MEFKPRIEVLLKDKDELLAALEKDDRNQWGHDAMWSVKSNFICDCIREITASGKYPYNSTVWEHVRAKLGLPYVRFENEGDTLSLLVYNAQCYVRHDDLVNAGYSPLTQEMIDQAYNKKMKIETASGRVYNVRKIGDKVYAMKPHARNRALIVDCDTPAKIVAKE